MPGMKEHELIEIPESELSDLIDELEAALKQDARELRIEWGTTTTSGDVK